MYKMLSHVNCLGMVSADLSGMFHFYGFCTINTRQILVPELKIDYIQGTRIKKLICTRCAQIITSIGELCEDCQVCSKLYPLEDLFVQEGSSSPFYCPIHMAKYKKSNDVEFRLAFKDVSLERLITNNTLVGE